MARQLRKESATGIHHVMLRGINRQNIFLDSEDYRVFIYYLHKLVRPKNELGQPMPAYASFYGSRGDRHLSHTHSPVPVTMAPTFFAFGCGLM